MTTNNSGDLIRTLRLEMNMTQKQLAEKLHISDRTVSKWERNAGVPDISLLPALSGLLGVGIKDILAGELIQNESVRGNMKKSVYFYCPVCGNFLVATGNAEVSCCGKTLEALVPQKAEIEHKLTVEAVEDEWFISSDHPMTKQHFISFVAFATGDRILLMKQYPEWNMQVRIPKREHGTLLWYCTQDGLFYQYI